MLLHRSDLMISKKTDLFALTLVLRNFECLQCFFLMFMKFSRNFAKPDPQAKFVKTKLKISKYIRILIFCRYFGILALGEIKMKVETC